VSFIPAIISARKIALLLTAVVVASYLLGNQLLDTIELKTYDMRLRSSPPAGPVKNVVIAAIDEKSLARLGRWPWSRRTLATLIKKLDALGARVIALDVFFAESENRKLLEQIQRLEGESGYSANSTPFAALKRALAADTKLADAIAESGHVVLSMVFLMSPGETRQIPPDEAQRVFNDVKAQAIRVTGAGDTADFSMPEPAGLLANVSDIRRAARYAGHINSIPDLDGTLRWTPLVMRYQGYFFPSADVQAVRVFKQTDDIVLHTSEYGITGLGLGDRVIATDQFGRALIHYYGPEQTIPTFSVADVLDDRLDPAAVAGKIVVVGATAKGIGDIRVTPYGSAFPGAEIRASTIQNLIDDDFINRPPWIRLLDVANMLALAALLCWLLPRGRLATGAGLALALFVLYTAAAVLIFRTELLWLNIVYPAMLIAILFFSFTIAKYVSAETGKRQIKAAFQHYVAPKIVDEIIDNVDRLRLGGEKRTLTVLFSDIRGFTAVAQALAPEDLVRLLNVYLTQMSEKVFRHEGLLDKYIGDAIMAVYGAPIYREDHALLACRTALDMLAELRLLQADWKAQGLPLLDIGIGINTGPMVVGNMGSRDRFDYTVIGDAVNLGSRIENLNKTYGTRVLLSEFTYACVRGEFPHLREIDVTQVRGRREPVKIYELLPSEADSSLDWLPEFQHAYGLLRQQRYREAAAIFARLSETEHDAVSRYHWQHCQAHTT
jgi:adenylate cyclase